MDDHYRMRLKLGNHEFEAEGAPAVVQEQFKKFLELLSSFPTKTVVSPDNVENPAATSTAANEVDSSLGKIMKMEDRVISLTIRPRDTARNAEDAVLLMLYGQKILRQNDSVTGAEVMSGITATGGLSVTRVDRLLEKLARDGDVIVVGERRSKTYRLTNAGLAKARQIATDLLAIVA